MNNQHEQLSALTDDELTAEELDKALDQMLTDEALFEQWERTTLQQAALHGQLNSAVLQSDLSQRIHDALEKEPAHFSESAVQLTRPGLLQRYSKLVTGTAIAASVAAVTLLSANLLQNSPEMTVPGVAQSPVQNPVQQTPVGIEFPATAVATAPQALSDTPVQQRDEAQWITVEPALQQKLSPYLNGHSRYTIATGTTGTVPAVRVVNLEDARD